MQFIYGTHCVINYFISLSLTPKRLHVFISSYTLLKLLSRQNQHPLLTNSLQLMTGSFMPFPAIRRCVLIHNTLTKFKV